MTLFQQFADSVTGLGLPPQFKNTRIKLTFIVFVLLSILLILGGLNYYDNSRQGLENLRNQIDSQIDKERPRLRNQIDLIEESRIKALGRIQFQIIINNLILVLVLCALTWEALYFLLLPLAKATKAREDFLIRASHELRTPLAILHSEISLSLSEKNYRKIIQINKESLLEIERLQALSDTLLGRNSSKSSKINVQKLISDIWNSLESINTKEIKLSIHSKKSLYITTDSIKFYQLIFSILENIIKHGKVNTLCSVFIDQNIIFVNEASENNYTSGTGMSIMQSLANDLNFDFTWENNEGIHKTVLILNNEID
jgi:signal transduction histidine kinase